MKQRVLATLVIAAALLSVGVTPSDALAVREHDDIGDSHESESFGADKQMDLSNNATGRSVGQSHTTYSSASARCEWLAKNNWLVTLR